MSARLKLFSRGGKIVPHFGRRELYSEWGRSPVGEVGDNNSHVRGRQLVLHSPSTTHTPSERARTRRTLRASVSAPPRALRASVFEQDILLLVRQKSAEGRPSRFSVFLCVGGQSAGLNRDILASDKEEPRLRARGVLFCPSRKSKIFTRAPVVRERSGTRL